MSDDKTQQTSPDIHFRPPAKVLVVDDSHLNRSFIVNTFNNPNYELLSATDGEQGLKQAKEKRPELILLDIMMPNMDGFEVCQHLKEDPATKNIPVIFITALDAIQDKLRAFDAGAVDFVTKPFNHKELIARVKTNVQLHRAIGQREEMLKIAMEEKRHESIARIAAGVSHNFNNMLGVAFGNITLIESIVDAKTIEPNAVAALRDVRKSLERMQDLVQKFLLLTNVSEHNETPEQEDVNIHALIDEVTDNITDQKKDSFKPIPVNVVNATDPAISIKCSHAHAREVFHLMFSEFIETTAGKTKIEVNAATGGNGVTIVVKVDNIQISQAVAESIFEPFAMPLANVGTGLSISVAKQLVEVNGGTIKSSSPGDRQIVFEITFAG